MNRLTSIETRESATTTVRIGTRGSALARWQSEWVADRLRVAHPGLTVTLVEIRTRGDRDRNSPLAQIAGGSSGTGLFTKEIQNALIDRSVEIAVHSLKDLPTAGPDTLTLGAIPEREDPTDALISPIHKTLAALPEGATVGTGSMRRRAMLMNARPDLHVVGIRGNVETRLGKASSGELDAVVLAGSGLNRLGLDGQITERLGPPRFLPAVGQGALGIECRADDEQTISLLAALDHQPTRLAVLAERACLAELEGGCMVPLAAWGREVEEGLALDVSVFDPDGRERIDCARVGPRSDPAGLGRLVAGELLALGAGRLLRAAREDS